MATTPVPIGLTIEPATEHDVPLLLALIRELAEFERLLDQMVADEAMLRAHLFGPQPKAEVVIARLADQPVGFALYFHNFSTFLGRPGIYLEDLYVRSGFRGQGCGAALLRHIGRVAVERGCGRLEWSVLNWNQRAIDFYKKLGAHPLSDWTLFRVTGPALDALGTESADSDS